ncbi:hypothetical protein [Bacillus sp. BP-3]|uniref:hypothetical protein n=1 Tax=Bacillus sp. BP-3 TaxID=3022773 RepID=UPI00232DBF99|nr:hypothetical protein [Bacillus sp. BP-3]MDC2865119.1 hypothetical protein [Bacillus sp. BP-3]
MSLLLVKLLKLLYFAGLILILFSIGKISETVERYARKTFGNRLSQKALYFIFVMITMCFEGASLWLLSIFFHWELITTLFVGSFLLIIMTWNTLYFRNAFHNQARAASRFFGGTDEHTEFRATGLSVHPFAIGTFLFGILSIVGSFLYYLPYLV